MASIPTAIGAAKGKLGSRYVWGAEGPDTFDCSGLMVWAWEKAGVHLPRTSQEQAKYGNPVSPKDIRPGDLVTSDWGSGPSSHVAMYIGDGKVIHAPRPGRTVTVATMDANYRSHVNAIRRVPGSTLDGITSAGFPSPGAILDWEKGFADSLLGAGKSVVGGAVTGTLLGPLKIVGGALGNIAGGMLSIGKFAELLLRLALPSTWVRIVCGLLGSVLLLLGTGFLVREARGAA